MCFVQSSLIEDTNGAVRRGAVSFSGFHGVDIAARPRAAAQVPRAVMI
jgi:hypothetical protein